MPAVKRRETCPPKTDLHSAAPRTGAPPTERQMVRAGCILNAKAKAAPHFTGKPAGRAALPLSPRAGLSRCCQIRRVQDRGLKNPLRVRGSAAAPRCTRVVGCARTLKPPACLSPPASSSFLPPPPSSERPSDVWRAAVFRVTTLAHRVHDEKNNKMFLSY